MQPYKYAHCLFNAKVVSASIVKLSAQMK